MCFRAALDEIYGARLERVVLFGSRARGEAQSDSDYDVAVFLKSLPDRWTELDRLAEYEEFLRAMQRVRAERADTPEKARDFLKEEGLLTEAGELTAPYRPAS